MFRIIFYCVYTRYIIAWNAEYCIGGEISFSDTRRFRQHLCLNSEWRCVLEKPTHYDWAKWVKWAEEQCGK